MNELISCNSVFPKLTTNQKPGAPIVTFQDGYHEPIAVVKADGTVELYREGAAPEAAKLFWDSIQIEGKTLRSHIAALEAALRKFMDLTSHGAYVPGMIAARNEAHRLLTSSETKDE